MNVLESFRLDNGMTVLVCELFSDDQVTKILRLDGMQIEEFSVEPVRACFSIPKSRQIVIKDRLPEHKFSHAVFV